MKLGIISAMESEINYILETSQMVNQIKLKKAIFYQCEIGDVELVVVASGVGKTNATVYTQVLIDYFDPTAVINIGIGGGLSDKLRPLDLVLGTTFSHHDVSIEQMESLKPFISTFEADGELVKLFDAYEGVKIRGHIASGESFIASETDRKRIIETHKPLLVDMETSSMAHCCYLNDKPFISLRSVSDLANDEADESYEENELAAANAAGKALLDVLGNMSL
ncbi:5'-methylthioadenosine/S-adenosylhomocysteine nucleosidase [Vagococcus fluvialis]|uniref:5'-methylthioadenosine/S-adenosylhomocysteine nucleosidase n=1 Tax=Vagococcus fluvialis TaxID=2738 RepID=UPI003B5C88FB